MGENQGRETRPLHSQSRVMALDYNVSMGVKISAWVVT